MAKVIVENVDGFYFKATDELGRSVDMDAPENGIGGDNGVRPMQMLLMGLGGCAGIDIVSILKKQKQDYKGISMEIDGKRPEGKMATPYNNIHIKVTITGNVNEDKARKAIDLSLDKYCSVAKTLDQLATINYALEIKS